MKFYFFYLTAAVVLLGACEPEEICDPDAVLMDEAELTSIASSAGSPGAGGGSASAQESEQDRNAAAMRPEAMQEALKNVGNTVNFGYDRFDLSDGAKKILDQQAAWLLQNPSVRIIVMGHCDERGTSEYNLALGTKRSEAVKAYLETKGVDPRRIETGSQGKEKPLIPGALTDAEHHANRRAETLIDFDR